jgi:hypothetical protein
MKSRKQAAAERPPLVFEIAVIAAIARDRRDRVYVQTGGT